MSRPFPPARPGSGVNRGPSLPATPPPNIRSTSNYEQPTPSRTTTTIPIPPRPVTSQGQPMRGSGVLPSRGGATPPSRTPPSTPPRGGFNGTATAPPSWKTTSNGPPLPSTPPPVLGPGRIPPSTGVKPGPPAPVNRRPPTTQPPAPNEQRQKRLSVSLHTDRQNVAAVVDLPINNEAVQEREVPPTPPARSFNGSATAPSVRSPPPSTSPRRDAPLPSTEQQYPSSPGPIRPPPRPLSRMAKPGPPLSTQNSSEALQRQPSGGSLNSPDSSDKQERLRQEALKEIVNTERDYVQHLELVSEVFLRPLKEQPKVISPQELATLFSNWELLVGVNIEILNNFDKDPSNIMVGRTFLEMMQYLKMYKIYCASQPTALKVLETLQRDNSAFSSFLQDCLANPKCKGQNLFSYLIKPIQRLCKYPLLIKVLLEHTNPSHPDYQNLTNALREIEDIVTYVNEGKRQAEKSQKIIDLAMATEGGESLGLVTPTRALEMEQNIQVIIKKGKPQQRKCMLFNDAVLLLKEAKKGAKMYKNPKLMSLGDIKVVNVSDTAEFSHGIELQYSSTKEKYVLIFATEEDKQKWLRDIKRIVKLYQQKKFEEMKKEEEEREAAAKNQPPPALSPPSGKRGSAIDLGASAPIQTRRATSYIVKETSTVIGSDSAPSPSTSKINLLKRRSSFNNKTQISVIKPMQPAATPPPVKYASKPILKGK